MAGRAGRLLALGGNAIMRASRLKIPVAKADVGATFEHTVIEVALATGARSEAILELEWDRVDFAKGIIDFNTAASRPNFLL